MYKVTILLIALLFFSTPLLANETSHKKLAIKLVKIYEKDIDNSYDIKNEVDNIIRQDKSLSPYRKHLIRFMSKYLNSRQLKQYLVIAFMKEFPEDKLKDIVRFLSSPAGKLWITKSSQFDKTIESIVKRIFSKHEGELIKMIEQD